MIVKWQTGWHGEIRRVECVRETEQCVFIRSDYGRDHKAMKRSGSEQYHDTWAGAKAYLVGRARQQVDVYKAYLHDARTRLGMIEGLKEPKEQQAQEAAR